MVNYSSVFPEKARELGKIVIADNLFLQRRNLSRPEFQCGDTPLWILKILENLFRKYLLLKSIYHVVFWNCRKMQNWKFICIFKLSFSHTNFFLVLLFSWPKHTTKLYITDVCKKLYRIAQNCIKLMFKNFLISALMGSKNVRNGNDYFPLSCRSYHFHVDFFSSSWIIYSQVDSSQI